MIGKGITEREAVKMWVNSFHSVPTGLIAKLVYFDQDNWWEVTKPTNGCEVYVYDEALPDSYSGGCDGKIIGCDEKAGLYCVEMENGYRVSLKEEDFEVSRDRDFPLCETMWSFKDEADNDWLKKMDGISIMSRCGFRIYESSEFGYFFGIDGTKFDFYEKCWIPLYRAWGLMRYSPTAL